MPDEITLDKEVFKALAGETRISVMKSLRERRKTQSELAKEIGIAAPTVKEHVDILARAGLVREIDDGHKWKYIELTVKGKTLLEPQDKRILVLLGTSLVGLIGSAFVAQGQLQQYMQVSNYNYALANANVARASIDVGGPVIEAAKAAAPNATSIAADATTATIMNAGGATAPASTELAQAAVQTLPSLPFFELGLMLVCLIVFGISVGMWIRQAHISS